MKSKVLRSCFALLAAFMLLCGTTAALAQSQPVPQPDLGAVSVEIIKRDGLQFKDLNKNGDLDAYEDWRLNAQERTADLLSQMTSEDKAAQMLHVTLVTLKESWFSELDIGFALAYTYLADGAKAAAENTNEIQALAETSRLGIPVVFSMDSVIGASWVDGATVLPDQITLAATGNVELVGKLARIQNEEMRAIGVRMSLSPIADLATDPRWGRVQECFGEDVQTATDMVVAVIEGLQGGAELTENSVIACVKHFPGSGSQTAGVDGSPLVYEDDSFAAALSIFRAAIDAGAASIMPYGYSTVPYLGGDAVENYAHESSTVMTELLMGNMGYTGIIQTDWGLSPTAAAVAGADVLGGASQREIGKMIDALTEEQLDQKVGKILMAKFELGIFENPYVDVDAAISILGTETHKETAKEAAAQALTLVKYENAVPLGGRHLIIAGSLAEDGHALSSGWAVDNYQAKNLLEALQSKAGAVNVTYIGDDISRIPANLAGAPAIVVIGEASGTHEPQWGSSTLIFPDAQTDMVKELHDAGATVIAVVLMNRPYVMADIAENSDVVLLAYRPGMTSGADAVAEALFGEHAIAGRTPYQIPASMDQVLTQREDVAKDIINPLFDYGYGIDVSVFGQ